MKKFVDFEAADDLAYTGEILVVVADDGMVDVENDVRSFHGAEFEDFETLFVHSHALLPEKSRSRTVYFDCQSNQHEREKQKDDSEKSQHFVKYRFDCFVHNPYTVAPGSELTFIFIFFLF